MENPSNLAVIEEILRKGKGITFTQEGALAIVDLESALHTLHAWESKEASTIEVGKEPILLPSIQVVDEIRNITNKEGVSFILGFIEKKNDFCLEARKLKKYATYVRFFRKNISSLVKIA